MEDKNIRLTDKQEMFAREYIIDFNATQAYIRAGYKSKDENSAGVQASRLLRNDKIVQKIEQLKKEREDKLEVNAEWVLREAIEIYRIAKGEKPHKMSYRGKDVEMCKTNLREANKALEIIGKHTSVKAFEKEVDFGDSTIFAVTMPKEFAQNDDK